MLGLGKGRWAVSQKHTLIRKFYRTIAVELYQNAQVSQVDIADLQWSDVKFKSMNNVKAP